uniref:Uncharacterized protein n=1 Tax=Magallana gigas TaxID=29159 RepID=A0A8W8I217_MAGGI
MATFPRDLKAEINRAIELCQQRLQYCEDQTTKPSPALDHLIKETFAYPWEDAHKEGKVSYYATPRMLTGNVEGPALNSLEILAEKQVKFDVIFIDADKTGYFQYYKVCLQVYHPP